MEISNWYHKKTIFFPGQNDNPDLYKINLITLPKRLENKAG